MSGAMFGPYEILDRIGAGSTANVFRAKMVRENGFERPVVIKKLFDHVQANPDVLEMFKHEARLLGLLTHPYIPQVYDLGCIDNIWFMAQEYVEGPTFSAIWDRIEKHNLAWSLPQALSVIAQLCEALHYVHDFRDETGVPLSLVHRDVNPANISLTKQGAIKLLDFGLVRSAAVNREGSTVKGTYAYMSPEQIRGRPLDRRSDVFALGVLFYELTTGVRLYTGSHMEVMSAIVERVAPRPSSVAKGYPREIEEVVMSCLQRDLAKRAASLKEVRDAIVEFARVAGIYLGHAQLESVALEVRRRGPPPGERISTKPEMKIERAKPVTQSSPQVSSRLPPQLPSAPSSPPVLPQRPRGRLWVPRHSVAKPPHSEEGVENDLNNLLSGLEGPKEKPDD